MDDIKKKIHQYFIDKTDLLAVKDRLTEEQLRKYVTEKIDELCEEHNIPLQEMERAAVVREIVGAMVSYGPLRPLLEDKSVTEIMVNGPQRIYVQRHGKIELTNIQFTDHHHLMHTIQKILAASGSSRRVDESSPYVDFSLRDGSRANVILPPVSLTGPCITIRKFSTDIENVDDLINKGMLDEKMAALLIGGIKAKLNMVFCGATGTGKTTLLNVLSRHIPAVERVVTIEDTAELRLMQDHVVSLQTKSANIEGKGVIAIRDLFLNSLRMRPDRIIIGEIRSEEALDLIQSIASGHSGSLAIVHADSPEDCFNRMVTMTLMTGIRLASEEIKKQIANAIDLIIYTELYMDGIRRITTITDVEYEPEEEQTYLRDIFHFEQEKLKDGRIQGKWHFNPRRPTFMKKFAKRNVELPGFFEDKKS